MQKQIDGGPRTNIHDAHSKGDWQIAGFLSLLAFVLAKEHLPPVFVAGPVDFPENKDWSDA